MSTHVAPRAARNGDARDRAVDVLVRVEADGAFAAPVLDGALDREPALEPRDRALATELVYGVLRCSPALDARLDACARKPGSFSRLDGWTRAVLRTAAFQILALDRVPVAAAVNHAVDRIGRHRSRGLGGFANAVLRALAKGATTRDPTARTQLAVESVPGWIRDEIRTLAESDAQVTETLSAMFAPVRNTTVRVQPARETRASLAERLRAALPEAEILEAAWSPWALHVSGGGDVTRTEAYAQGRFSVQEEGAQLVALAAGARPGRKVLDVCAGRGGKTTALAQCMEGRGVLHAVERHPGKLARIAMELERLGLAGPSLAFEAQAADVTKGWGALGARMPAEGYDVVVVDAPCSGLGTLGRRPDVMLREARHDPAARAELLRVQRTVLVRAAERVAPGGTLLYAVCTLTRAEGDDAIASLHAAMPGCWSPADDPEGPGCVRAVRSILWPHAHGTDGFQVFRLRRRPSA